MYVTVLVQVALNRLYNITHTAATSQASRRTTLVISQHLLKGAVAMSQALPLAASGAILVFSNCATSKCPARSASNSGVPNPPAD